MATLVLNRNSLSVKLESEHLLIHEHADGGGFSRLPLVDVERVVVVGQPAISFPVLAELLDRGIPCSFLTSGGRWRGMMDGDGGFHAGRRVRQYERVNDPAFALLLSRQTVLAKISAGRRTIQRLAAERRIHLADDPDWLSLTQLKGRLSRMETVEAVRGVEGMAATLYFRLLGGFFPPDAPFTGRSRRPPLDPANALLSFIYTLLTGAFTAAVRVHGLDVAGGYFHRGRDRSPALALDLMEPFRPAWADRLALDLLNHRRVRAERHFEQADGGVYLNESGRGIVFRAFDELMERCRKTDRGSVSCRQMIDQEVCRFIALLERDM